jgi:hypothetical protein
MNELNSSLNLSRCILYYPTISIPTGNWLRQSLLYWDEIGSIVPHSYDGTALTRYSPDIQYLKTEGEFRPFWPDDCIFRQGYNKPQELEEEFKSILESPNFQRLVSPQTGKLSSRIHEDKISHNLFYFLEERGLAKRIPSNYEWYQFEDHTALLYMAVLAKHIADGDIHSTIPGTDLPVYENLIFQAMTETDGVACLATNFWNALPIPREDVPLSDIIELKRKRRAELLNFRQLLDEFQSNLKKCESQAEAHHVIVSFKEKLEKGISELTAVLNDSRLATIAGSIKTLIKLDSPALWAPLVVALGQASKVTDIPIPWSIAGIGVLGAIEIFAYLTDKRNEKRATLRNSPFSYLTYAKQEKITG